MTNSNTMTIAAEIEALAADLLKINATIDLVGKPAIDAANKIDKQLKDAKDRFATALADEQVEARNQRLARISDVRVEVKPGNSLVDTIFVIHYKLLTWDMVAKESLPKQHTSNGFAALADDVYEYLVTEKPENIPAEIMRLAPGKPADALAIYLQGKGRGHFASASCFGSLNA